MLWLFVGPSGVHLLDFFCSSIQFYLLLSPSFCFISFLYLGLYVLGGDALIKPNFYVSWSTSELRVWLVPLNRFKLSSKIFYWPFQGGTSFVDLLCFYVFVLSCVRYVFVRVCSYVLCGHLLGKGWPLGSRLWCLTIRLSLSHWYPGSDVVLDCIDA